MAATHIYRIIESILSYTRTSLEYEDDLSEMWQTYRCVRQDGVLYAFSFILCIGDILQAVAKEHSCCYICIRKTNTQTYSYDFITFCPPPAGLRKC